MIEREFIAQKTKEYYIRKHIDATLRGAEISDIKLKKIPLGEKIIITTSRPSLIVGSKGSNIKALTAHLKKNFGLENPRVEIVEVKNPYADASVVAARIASSLERFGSARFKGVGHKTMANVLRAGSLGVEIKISGKIPGARAKSWRFYQGYLKKSGDIATSGVQTAYSSALLKTGVIGIQVRIMPPGLTLPDHIEILDEVQQEESVQDLEKEKEVSKEVAGEKEPKKVAPKKKTTKKKAAKKKEAVEETKSEEAQAEATEEKKEESEAPAKEVETEEKVGAPLEE